MEPGALLAEAPLFANLDDAALTGLASIAQSRVLRSGETLYEAGEPAAAFHIVASGRLGVTADGSLLGYVGRLEPAGEMGVILGEPRTSTVKAMRDSLVVSIPADDFLVFLDRQSPALLALSRLMIRRLREAGRKRMQAATEVQGTIAIIPASSDVPVMTLAEALVGRLGGWPSARLITAAHVDAALGADAAQAPLSDDAASTRLMAWLSRLESRHRYVIYAAGDDRDTWALRCLHNADRVLVLAEASARPAQVPVLDELHAGGLLAPVELVLLRPEGDPSPYTEAWLEETQARAHYFVHPWDEGELSALARQLTGRGVGLVLGGGGARGFAHIGLIRALEQLQIPVDAVGGTSMGAFMAALVACGIESVEIANIARETFVRNNYLNDYAMPRTSIASLLRGRKFTGRLQEIFGERRIEELRRTFFCVSTNLTTGATVVHDHGPLYAWVGTSMAVPGLAPPIAFEGDLLCDGAVVDNLPTDIMQRFERGSIVACNVSSEGAISAPGAGIGGPDPEALLNWQGATTAPRLGEILVRSATLTSVTSMEQAAERADVYLAMPVQDFGMFDWKRLDELAELGYAYAVEQLTPIRDELLH